MRLLIILLFISSQAISQSATLDSLVHRKNMGSEDVHIKVPGWLLRFGLKLASDDNEAARKMKTLRKGLGKAEIVVLENRGIGSNIVRQIHHDFVCDGYEDYVHIREGSQFVNILLKEDGDMIRNLLITVNDGDEEFVAVKLKTKLSHQALAAVINENN
ncbi:MAG: DUF4252 domain-containing protein [Saprospiraceae bacterium]|nr:DUF4252 domain-containing protein [Saprospiraceae bacterium]